MQAKAPGVHTNQSISFTPPKECIFSAIMPHCQPVGMRGESSMTHQPMYLVPITRDRADPALSRAQVHCRRAASDISVRLNHAKTSSSLLLLLLFLILVQDIGFITHTAGPPAAHVLLLLLYFMLVRLLSLPLSSIQHQSCCCS